MTDFDYFKLICDIKEKFELEFGIEPTHLVVGIKDFYDMERSPALFDRFKYIRDTTTQGVLGSYIAGLKVIKTQSIEGFSVGYLIPQK